ncbi:B-cell receptor CD22 B-lymphocyte cell adhesion molecule [Channa argus]|uniref:B-cell receptor CD22 B-lymphocyte cell adhesion molecule n=1 Tax=Channa argus TaxID=215402 RepID=A0A6G1PCK0_CHAAH|nr:B-cell receptor CD22 B-lymphocyte cell adhesion molecule [Channa argus]
MQCHSSCDLPGRPSYIWYNNGQKIKGQTSHYFSGNIKDLGSISCAVKRQETFPSPSVYPPQLPSVSVSPSAEIVEGSSVTLTCSSDANPAANYTWYKKNQTVVNKKNENQPLNQEPQLVFASIQSSDSGQYYCEAENELGRSRSGDISLNVKYPRQLPSVSVSPSAEIVEGSSVTLTCSSDANPAANYTWFKQKGPDPKYIHEKPQLVFRSIKSSASGHYYCTAENKLGRRTSEVVSINVKYPPQLPSVSVSPSAEIVEGSSVTLTCSSDANPAAKYTWYKKNQTVVNKENRNLNVKPLNQEPQLVFASIQSSYSGQYYCEAENKLGRSRSEDVSLNVKWKSLTITNIISLTLVVLIPLLVMSLWMRKKKTQNFKSELNESVEMIESVSQHDYQIISAATSITAAQRDDTEQHKDLV